MKHYKTNSCVVLFWPMHQKTKRKTYWTPQYADVIYQNKVRIETIMKYTEDDKPLWNTHMVKDNGAFIILWPRKPLNTPLPMTDLYSLQSA
jgi:hypothetical protein